MTLGSVGCLRFVIAVSVRRSIPTGHRHHWISAASNTYRRRSLTGACDVQRSNLRLSDVHISMHFDIINLRSVTCNLITVKRID